MAWNSICYSRILNDDFYKLTPFFVFVGNKSELSKSVSPYTFIRCESCDNDNALVVDLPSQYGFRCTVCKKAIYKKVESYLDFTDYIEKDFYDLS